MSDRTSYKPESKPRVDPDIADSSSVWKNLQSAALACSMHGDPAFGPDWSPFASIQSAVKYMSVATTSTHLHLEEQASHFIRASLHLLKAKQYYLALSRSSDERNSDNQALGSSLRRFVTQLDIVSSTRMAFILHNFS